MTLLDFVNTYSPFEVHSTGYELPDTKYNFVVKYRRYPNNNRDKNRYVKDVVGEETSPSQYPTTTHTRTATAVELYRLLVYMPSYIEHESRVKAHYVFERIVDYGELTDDELNMLTLFAKL
jgi:hypothetical protein